MIMYLSSQLINLMNENFSFKKRKKKRKKDVLTLKRTSKLKTITMDNFKNYVKLFQN